MVIAIIAILAALLFPTFAKAKWRSNNSVCLSNLRQLGIVMQGYAEDNDDHMPVGADSYWGDVVRLPTAGTPWLNVVMADRAPHQLWKCPADLGFRWWNSTFTVATTTYSPSCYVSRGQSYDYNLLMVWDPVRQRVAPLAVAQVKTPTDIVLLKDAHFSWHNANSPRNPKLRDLNEPPAWNCLFLDGHAERRTPAWHLTYTVDIRSWWYDQNNPRP